MAGTKADSFGLRSLYNDNSNDTLYVTSDGLRYYYTDSVGNRVDKWSSLAIESKVAAANGTSSLSFTMSHNIKNFNSRTIVAVCNGGATSGRQIISVVPSSSSAVTVNFDGNLPTSGNVFITFIYQMV